MSTREMGTEGVRPEQKKEEKQRDASVDARLLSQRSSPNACAKAILLLLCEAHDTEGGRRHTLLPKRDRKREVLCAHPTRRLSLAQCKGCCANRMYRV